MDLLYYKISTLAIFLIILKHCIGLDLSSQVVWINQLDLTKESGIKFRWMNTEQDKDGQRWLLMEVSAKATGYVGVGFSPNGGMIDGDMAIAWMNSDGKPNLRDFYGIENGLPIEDPSQDYHLLNFEVNGDWTTVTFKRRWDTCDSNDFTITNDTIRLIWAHSNIKPSVIQETFRASYHGAGKRGVKSVIITEGASKPTFPDEAPQRFPGSKSFDMKMDNVQITLKDTYYFCKMMKFTDLQKKHHMIGWKPLIQNENQDIVHHMLLYECSVPKEEISIFDNFYENHPGGACFTPNMPPEWGKNCVGFSLIWVVGSEGEMLPNHVGTPLGEMHGGSTYFMLEMHYENPAHRITTDSSGIRLYYTDQLRKYDGGTLLLGYRHSPFLLIPPNQNDFMINGVCGSECTSKKIRLKHFRNGIELPIIAEDNYFDFNYQVPRTLKEEITILPGDELVVECEYNTKNVNRYVIGGLATDQEMCQIFAFYYPRIPFSQCTSQPEFYDFLKGLHLDKIEGERVLKALNMPYAPNLLPAEDMEKDVENNAKEMEAIEQGLGFKSVFNHMNITEPVSLLGKTVGQYLEEIKWTDKKGKTLERFWREGKHYQFCSKPGLQRVILDKHIIEYPDIKMAIEKKPSPVCTRENYILRSSGFNLKATAFLILSLAVVLPRVL